MGQNSKIGWTDHTWNWARGCRKVSEGCKFCYMMRDGSVHKYDFNTVTRTKPNTFNSPLKYPPGPARVFVSSLTDWAIEEIDEYRAEAWEIIRQRRDLTFMLLTKRVDRILHCLPEDWSPENYPHVWLGVTIENQKRANERLYKFLQIPAAVHFVSYEPAIGPVDFSKVFYKGKKWFSTIDRRFGEGNKMFAGEHWGKLLDWIIIGGESGNENGPWQYRPAEIPWFEKVIRDCKNNGVAVFMKQTGTYISKELKLRDRHGADIDEWPQQLRIQQFPDDRTNASAGA